MSAQELIEKNMKSADEGDSMAQYLLADAYDSLGNKKLAVFWMQKSADAGNTEAMLR